MSDLLTSAIVQLRVIAALMLRESRTRYGKSQLGYLWSLAEPIAIVLTFSVVFQAMGHPPPIGESHAVFFSTGILAFSTYRRTASFCATAFTSNESLLTFPIVQQIDTLFARALLEYFTSILSLILIFSGLILIWDIDLPNDVGSMMLAMSVLVLLGLGHGALTAVIGSYSPSWQRVDEMLSRPLFFISGVFFVPSMLPPSVQDVLSWNPLLHGIELLRSGYYSQYRAEFVDVGYLLGFACILLLVALSAERVMRLRPERDN